MTEADRQREYRIRRAAKLERLGRASGALIAILTKLEGNTKPLAIELREIATEGLK